MHVWVARQDLWHTHMTYLLSLVTGRKETAEARWRLMMGGSACNHYRFHCPDWVLNIALEKGTGWVSVQCGWSICCCFTFPMLSSSSPSHCCLSSSYLQVGKRHLSFYLFVPPFPWCLMGRQKSRHVRGPVGSQMHVLSLTHMFL